MKRVQVMNKIANRDAEETTEGDRFFTPQALARQLISITPIQANDSLLDSAKGTGAFYDNYPTGHPKEWAEITEGENFYQLTNKYDWIITNPPFSQLRKWLVKSCTTAVKGFAYIIPLHGLTEHRVRLCAELGFNITSLTLFKNPKEWDLGFQMAWVVWEKTEPTNVKMLNPPVGYQTSILDF